MAKEPTTKLFQLHLYPNGINCEGYTNLFVRAEGEADARWQIENLISDILRAFTREQFGSEDFSQTKRIIVSKTKIHMPS